MGDGDGVSETGAAVLLRHLDHRAVIGGLFGRGRWRGRRAPRFQERDREQRHTLQPGPDPSATGLGFTPDPGRAPKTRAEAERLARAVAAAPVN
ncbi:hypothetical protein [Streptomyces sp. NPDC097610]|uniref:hypothetical protein n=1 Tax=Streptomyces sp. NPDC097610 TaxID=3157227 RepID=UPI003321BB09